MQVSRIQSYNTNRPTFQRFNIAIQAKKIAENCPKKMEIAKYAENRFKNSEAIDFAIENHFVPNILIKNTGENLIGHLKASILGDRALRVRDRWTKLDFVLPSNMNAEKALELINNQKDKTSKAIQIADLIEKSAKEHNGRYLI